MPTDWRRFTGPEVSVPYSRFIPTVTKTAEELRASLITPDGKRCDGRALHESRPLSVVRTGVVSQAKGSAYVELQNTKVICSVFAPREIPNRNEFSHLGQLYCEIKMASWSCATRRSAAPEPDERQLSDALRQALEPAVVRSAFPNYQVDVMVLILEHDGGCLGAAVTAAGLALVDAAVPVYDVICATSLAVLADTVLMDPTAAEESVCSGGAEDADRDHGLVTLALMPSHDLICDYTQTGSMDMETVTKAIDILRTECIEKIVPEIQGCLLKNVQSALKTRQKETEHSRAREESLRRSVAEMKNKLRVS